MEKVASLFTPYEMTPSPLTIFQRRLPVEEGQLHFIVPAGIGDNLWIISKLWQVCMERDVTFWLPAAEQKRSGDLFKMMGLRYGYMPDLTTQWVWDRPGSPSIPDTGAVLSVQPNRHLEHGHRIEKWYPEYEFRNPVEFMDINTALYKVDAKCSHYVVGFMSQMGYMETGGNIKAAQWARIWRKVEEDIGDVVLIAAGNDASFLDEVMKFYEPSLAPAVNAPLDQVAALFAGAEMAIGVASGPMILSTYMGIPTLHAYPRWLAPMAGTWEPEGYQWSACFLDNLENVVREGITFDGRRQMIEMREAAQTPLKVSAYKNPRWTIPKLPVAREVSGNGKEEKKQNGTSHAITAQPDTRPPLPVQGEPSVAS